MSKRGSSPKPGNWKQLGAWGGEGEWPSNPSPGMRPQEQKGLWWTRQLPNFWCQRKGGTAQLSRGSGQGRGSTADFAKVRADFWQADVRSGMSQESADLLHGFTLQALGPIFLSSNSLQKFPSNNRVQGFLGQAISHKGRRLPWEYAKAVGDDGCS